MANPGSAAARRAKADVFAAGVRPTISILRCHGLTLRQTAAKLTMMGIKTPKGCGIWTATGVRRVLARASAYDGTQAPPSWAYRHDRGRG